MQYCAVYSTMNHEDNTIIVTLRISTSTLPRYDHVLWARGATSRTRFHQLFACPTSIHQLRRPDIKHPLPCETRGSIESSRRAEPTPPRRIIDVLFSKLGFFLGPQSPEEGVGVVPLDPASCRKARRVHSWSNSKGIFTSCKVPPE